MGVLTMKRVGEIGTGLAIGILFILIVGYVPGVSAGWGIEAKFEPKQGSRYGRFVGKVTYWDTNDPTPNPLYGCNVCYSNVHIGYTTPGHYGYYFGEMYLPEAITTKTIGELAQQAARYGYLNREFWSTIEYTGEASCFYLGYLKPTGPNSLTSTPFPGGSTICNPPVIIPTVCDIREPQIELNHNTLLAGEVNGHTVSKRLHVACNFDYQVRIMSSDGSGSVYFNGLNGFRSDLKVDGVNLGEGKIVNATPAGVEMLLTSTLAGYDGSLGVFHGTKIIVVSLP